MRATECGITLTGYYFQKNLQGDIIAIIDKDAQTVARYSYDAWGACVLTEGSHMIANINPFRYRGYYYDKEDQLYYVQSRYYDPHVCRFINADDLKYLGTTNNAIGFNLYSYCDNTPTNRSDVNGHSWISDRINDLKKAAKKVVKAVSNTTKKVVSTVKKVTKTVSNTVVKTTKKVSAAVVNTTRKIAATISGAVTTVVDWTKNRIDDICKGVKSIAQKAKECVITAWNWVTKKAIPGVENFFTETVWKKWIVGGLWETFCKDWVWETFCKDWIWEGVVNDWFLDKVCKRQLWENIIKIGRAHV